MTAQNITILTEEEANTPATMSTANVWRAMVVVERLAKTGDVSITEYPELYQFYNELKTAVENALGRSVDDILADFRKRLEEASKNLGNQDNNTGDAQ
ncbi:MAG: hypothetical protein D6698_12270 [Gammaproteobacteria bacterium]|nr:MAG: hypothetical protein D6698_12270 [Gammaproteobacteria bacterium]